MSGKRVASKRNQKCSCGSGRKHKKCCGAVEQRAKPSAISPVPQYAPSPAGPGKPPIDGRNWLFKVESQYKLDVDLALKAVQDDELRARVINGEVYIDWEMLRPRMPFGPASHAAERFIPILNGMLAVRFAAFGGLKVKSILGVSDDGQWMPVSWASFTASGGDHVKVATAFLNDGGPTIGSLYRLATTNAAVSEALLYFGRNSEPFFDLYKAFEVVMDTVGGQDRAAGLGLAAAVDCARFTRSANDPLISGVFARHSQKPSAPIKDPMNPLQAREFVRTVIEKWIAHLTNTPQGEAPPQATQTTTE